MIGFGARHTGAMTDASTSSSPSNAAAPPATAVIDVTDATFEQQVVERSKQVPVVVDLWAPWCGPCRTLGPILEQVVAATGGDVVLAKVNVDENPQVSAAFRVQGIPAVYALKDGRPVDGFVGAQGQPAVEAFVQALLPTDAEREVAELLEAGDEASLRDVLERDPGNEEAVLDLADLLADRGGPDATGEALALLDRIPDSSRGRQIAARARAGDELEGGVDVSAKLDALLDRVKQDEAARQEFVDLLELLGPDDPRTADYRRALTARLY